MDTITPSAPDNEIILINNHIEKYKDNNIITSLNYWLINHAQLNISMDDRFNQINELFEFINNVNTQDTQTKQYFLQKTKLLLKDEPENYSVSTILFIILLICVCIMILGYLGYLVGKNKI